MKWWGHYTFNSPGSKVLWMEISAASGNYSGHDCRAVQSWTRVRPCRRSRRWWRRGGERSLGRFGSRFGRWGVLSIGNGFSKGHPTRPLVSTATTAKSTFLKAWLCWQWYVNEIYKKLEMEKVWVGGQTDRYRFLLPLSPTRQTYVIV